MTGKMKRNQMAGNIVLFQRKAEDIYDRQGEFNVNNKQ